ncbi:PTS beta-glucoside transporter subunit IIABC [Candidatus Puniceispirillum sp.]|nr:PTS beta-glucoside transporter subunit IIABC [Candidatus Puniceispirillum sp.]
MGEHNPFAKMGMIQFWAISTIVYLIFPVSFILSYIAFGSLFTKQLVAALLQDFLQTMLVAIGALIILIWLTVHYLGSTLAGWLVGNRNYRVMIITNVIDGCRYRFEGW